MVSFSVQKLLILIRSHWFIFGFVFIILGCGSNKILLWFMSKSVLPVFFSRSFIVYGLTFMLLIHFEFILGYTVRGCSDFILLHVAVQFFQQHLLKRLSFFHSMFLPPCVTDELTIGSWVYFWALYPVPLLCQDHTVWITIVLHCRLTSGSLFLQVPFFFLKIALAIWGLLCFHPNFKIFCSSSVKSIIGNLIGIALKLYIALGSIFI